MLTYVIIFNLCNVVGDLRRAWILLLEVFFVYPADALHAVIDRFVVRVGSTFRLSCRLDKQNGMSCRHLNYPKIFNALSAEFINVQGIYQTTEELF